MPRLHRYRLFTGVEYPIPDKTLHNIRVYSKNRNSRCITYPTLRRLAIELKANKHNKLEVEL